MEHKIRQTHLTCPNCGATATLDETWLPPSGYNPRLRRFICPNHFCNQHTYKEPSRYLIDQADRLIG